MAKRGREMKKYKIWFQLETGHCDEIITNGKGSLIRSLIDFIEIGIQEMKVEIYDERGER